MPSADLDTLKRRPLAPFCLQHLGYKLDKQKSCRGWADLRSPKGFSILIRTQPNPNGHFGFTRRDGSGRGTIIDLLKQEGWSWQQIIALANQGTPTQLAAPPPSSLAKQAEIPHKPPSRSLFVPFAKTPKDSYLEQRGISRQTLQLFQQGSLTRSVNFPLFELKQGGFKLFSSIRYSRGSAGHVKYFRSGPRGSSVSLLAQFQLFHIGEFLPLQGLYLFESPIDALSFAQLHWGKLPLHRCLLLSLCGNPGQAFLQAFPALLAFLRPKNLTYAFDNDKQGRAFAAELGAIAKGELLFPQAKDWNKQLFVSNFKAF